MISSFVCISTAFLSCKMLQCSDSIQFYSPITCNLVFFWIHITFIIQLPNLMSLFMVVTVQENLKQWGFIYVVVSNCKFCIYSHPLNSKFTIWQHTNLTKSYFSSLKLRVMTKVHFGNITKEGSQISCI